MPRLELRISDELLAEVDGARGGMPRGTFVKRVVEKALGECVVAPGMVAETGSSPRPSAPSRRSVEPVPFSVPSRAPVRSWRQHRPTCSCMVCKPPKETG